MRKRPTAAIVTGVVAVAIIVLQLATTAAATAGWQVAPSPARGRGRTAAPTTGRSPCAGRRSNSRLTGTIKLSSVGRTNITGSVRGGTIRFGTVGNARAITYSGSVSGKSMSGTYKTGGVGGSWRAHKTS